MSRPILYVKPGCPWCTEAVAFLKRHNVAFDTRNVTFDREARRRMQEISGQSRTPTLEFGAFVCADFDTDELMVALSKEPEIRSQLGLDKAGA